MDPQLPDYYRLLRSADLNEAIRNFDVPANMDAFMRAAANPKSRNFLIDFSDDEAWGGFDLQADSFAKLLKSPRPPSLNTRWINIWIPHEQRDVLTEFAKHWDFSPRLLGFMCSSPLKYSRSAYTSKSNISSTSSSRRRAPDRSDHESHKPSPTSSSLDPSLDLEERIGLDELKLADPNYNDTLNQYVLANEIWHYSTVDSGRRYLCLGFNTLHCTGPLPGTPSDPVHQNLPSGKRVWSWLALCEDKTVITIQEDPFPYRNGTLSLREQQHLSIIRRNLSTVFAQCSKARVSESNSQQLPIRARVGSSEEETAHRPTDVPGLLFYYLFDDWYTTYSLIARREHQYAALLNNLRVEMLTRADLGHVDRLHHIGRQLGVLKRLYEGYNLLIEQVLEKQEQSLASLKNSHLLAAGSGVASMSSSHPGLVDAGRDLLGVALSSAARMRFERLKHRIKLYAVAEIEECLEQKDSMVMMNFNLIAIKESYSVERLSRITILLAKVTILFMPISVVCAYFSCQFTDQSFQVKAFWEWFAGVFAASIVALSIFSMTTGTNESSLLYKPLSRKAWELGVRLMRRRGRGGQSGEDEG
ncbi:hypothetical protein EJ06DRAFT_492863 [Trichodelitschia bisporula]|uniref:ADP-ribosylation factor n=1 Tax=Trichodelitschia bisporula TaxID=703511 RepID=A0A6G1I0N9_9PEZI|nr:hypothetical protein EJ06DRAFT_492863 [Trichodelitschia bisporula]